MKSLYLTKRQSTLTFGSIFSKFQSGFRQGYNAKQMLKKAKNSC